MTNIKSVIAELREHHRGITFYRRMSYGKDNGHGWQKIDLKHYLPQLLEYVEELETKIEMECTTASNLDARYIIPEGIKVAGGHMAMSYIEDLGGEIRIMQAQLKKQQERISVLEASCQKK